MDPRLREGDEREVSMQLIPAIDMKDGRCVRLYQGDFNAQTVYADNPLDIFENYLAFGAQRIHLVDLDGAKDGSQHNLPIIRAMVDKRAAQIQVGGGLRTLQRVQDLLAAGVQRAVVGSVAVTAPDDVVAWSKAVGVDHLVLAFDVRIDPQGTPWLTTHGWQSQSTVTLWDAVERYVAQGFNHVLCTDISRDGALTGPNQALYRDAVRRFPQVQWQASGGVACAADLHALRDCGVAAVISGRALLENKISPEDLQPFLPNASSPA
jgi:phosphoribosylformimino-5-aminoimidazole carboxamide ribotide isomerase